MEWAIKIVVAVVRAGVWDLRWATRVESSSMLDSKGWRGPGVGGDVTGALVGRERP